MYVVVYLERRLQPDQSGEAQSRQAPSPVHGGGAWNTRYPTPAHPGPVSERHVVWAEAIATGEQWHVVVERYSSKAAFKLAQDLGLRGETLAQRKLGPPGEGQPGGKDAHG